MQGGATAAKPDQTPAPDAMPPSSLSMIASAAPVGLTLRDEAVPANSLGLLASNLTVQDRIALSDARLRSWGPLQSSLASSSPTASCWLASG